MTEQERTEGTEERRLCFLLISLLYREEPLKYDILVEKCLFVDVKAVEAVHPIHKAQQLSYMKLLDIPLRLAINFNALMLTDGSSRLILPGANLE